MSEPKFIQSAVSTGGRATVANASVDGSGTMVVIAEATTPAGLRIDRIKFTANATTAANTLRIYITAAPGATANTSANTKCVHEIAVTAVTKSNTAVGWSSDWILDPPLVLQNGHSLRFAPAVALAAGFDAVVVSGGNL